MKRKLKVNPITFPKKGIKSYHYLRIHVFKTDFNPALNSLKDSALTTYCPKLFHSFTM